MHLAATGVLMLVGLMILLLTWRQADDIAVAVVPHCEADSGESFVRLINPTAPTVPYRVERRAYGSGTPVPTPAPCAIAGTTLVTSSRVRAAQRHPLCPMTQPSGTIIATSSSRTPPGRTRPR